MSIAFVFVLNLDVLICSFATDRSFVATKKYCNQGMILISAVKSIMFRSLTQGVLLFKGVSDILLREYCTAKF